MTIETEDWNGDLAPEGGDDVCDGAGDTALEGAPTSAAARGWGSGWPQCQTNHLVTISVPGGVRLSVRREIAPLVAWLCKETVRRGYRLHSGQCWGFACRAIRGTSSPSNHSWGLAIDLNSLANPMGPRLVTDMPAWMPGLWTDHGFRWGGKYTGRKDAMHYEYLGTPAQAKATIARLTAGNKSHPAAKTSATATRAPAFPLSAGHYFSTENGDPHRHSGKNPADRPSITQFQRRLLERGWNLGPSAADGFFGPHVHGVVLKFQTKNRLEPDGLVGPATWRTIWEAPVT